eukprot:CAMPEP_0182913908 /NCGR_PEP_ID=MMETSP0034_2-20130328/38276_1 /TAXON_ID=156128 /ORGANISM="Nephroselmis pyriformis, Strain CCMP717" /LENGTH=313 /DNA_ID=CAMNT_0025050637 /DNA_START=98 /DNA_END=1039 /DNA_ORIENTATION=-
MPSASKLVKKEAYDAKLCDALASHTKAILVHADNVGSLQFANIRKALRPDSLIIMGKNTMMKRSIRVYIENTGDSKWEVLLEHLIGNVGLIFTKSELTDVRDEVAKFKVGAPARVGLVAPVDVTIPAGNTGMDPSQTSFFQVLNIPTKINKGTVEIINDVEIIKTGDKVGSSEAALLSKLGIKPFSYGLELLQIFDDGALFDPKVLDLTDEDLEKSFMAGVCKIASISLATGYPTLAAVPHAVINGFKKVVAIALGTEFTFPQAEKVKAALAAGPAVGSGGGGGGGGGAAAAAKAPEPEPEEEEEDMGFDLFD